jgi:class 3 adenylate cyclase/TolB-like protein/Tfp pilus assembly protein PilF
MEEGSVRRRLAAILAADVAGYSRLMGADEEGTLRHLQAHRRELIDPKIREHKGRLVKTTGDGMLVEFSSVVDAVRCAVEMQRAMIDREADAAEERRIRFRIGINLGDIIIDKGDIFGDGVNVAARLEALAEPGGLCISSTVRDHIGDRLPYAFADEGEQSVKNIARLVQVFAMDDAAIAATPLVPPKPPPRFAFNSATTLALALVILAGGGGIAAWQMWPTPSGTHEAKPAPRLSIVVLPFGNLSNDPEQDYFVDAITDDLTTDLSHISGSFVIARTTASTYKDKPVDLKQIGRDLGVRYVLEGSVRRLGEQVQVNVQLIDAETGAHVWADRFDTDRSNLAKAQSEITGRLARVLNVELVAAVGRRIERENPTSLDVRDLVMRGWAAYFLPSTETSAHQALQFFEQALQIDPAAAEAKVGVADILIENTIKGWDKSPKADQARAEKLLMEALESNNNDPRAHYGMGLLRRLQNRLEESRIELEKALTLDRNFSSALLQLGYTLNAMGEPAAALPYFEKSLQLNPRAQNIAFQYSGLGFCHLYLGHTDEAADFFRKAKAANPRLWYVYFGLAGALGLRGDLDEAKASIAEAAKLRPDLRSLKQLITATHMGEQSRAISERTLYAGLRKAGMPEE